MKKVNPVYPTEAAWTRFQEIPNFAEGLYDLGSQIYAWLTPNGSWGESNAGLIVGEKTSLLIDTLWDVRLTLRMLSAMEPLTGKAPITRLINTHADGDHFWGNQLIPTAEIIASHAAAEEMRDIKPLKMRMFGFLGTCLTMLKFGGADKAGRWFQGMVRPYAFKEVKPTLPTRTFSRSLRLELEGRPIELMEVGPAHTSGDVMVFIPDAKVLFTGDILFYGSTPVMWVGPVQNWLDALDKILAMDAQTIIPGHGPVTDKDGVQDVKAYWEYLDRHVRDRFRRGLSARQAAYDIVFTGDFDKQPFARWNSPERIMTNTHIIYRHLQGNTGPLKPPELLKIMWRQALLAHDLPLAQPAVMRKTFEEHTP